MPYTEDQLDEHNIWFDPPGRATVFVGPCSGSPWVGPTIPLDGRRYHCAGKVILRNGVELFANLPLRTDTFDFLIREEVYCKVGELWYGMDEPSLYERLGLSREQALPYTWLPDIPLAYREPGPYPMHFGSAAGD